jgi:hypothetical protein
MRKKSLKPDQNGLIWVNIGWKQTKSGGRSQAKFCLGEIVKDAERRNARIEELWERIESRSSNLLWDDLTFSMAKQLAKGEMQIVIGPEHQEDVDDYAKRISRLSQAYLSINFAPADPESFDAGKEMLEDIVADVAADLIDQFGITPTKRIGRPSDGTLHKAFDRFIAWIEQDYFDSAEGHVSDNGMTKIRQVRTLKDHFADRPLSAMSDFDSLDTMFAYLRKRPISKRTGKPMKRKSCQNYIGELGRFCDWLDLTSEFSWQLPERFNRIKRKVDELEEDIASEASDIFVFSRDQLRILYRYAAPLDRLLILLGLNCAFGADQTGRLRLKEARLTKKMPMIRRIRRKKKVLGKHFLWKHTRTLLKWAIDRREKLATEESADFLIVKQTGKPFWRKTAGGNRARDIPNYWDRLLARIREDHPDFPKVGFNTLRDTSVNFIRRIADQEIASIHATHRHHSPDKNLPRYSNALWKKVFIAQRQMERKLTQMFEAVPDPTVVPKQAYVSLGKRDRIVELHKEGRPVREIAKEVGVSQMTVYRTLEANETTERAGASE